MSVVPDYLNRTDKSYHAYNSFIFPQTNKCRQTDRMTNRQNKTEYLTNYMKHGHFWKVNRPSASQETTSILQNQMIHYQGPKAPTTHPISLRSILVSSSHLCLLPRSKFPSGFQSVCHMTCQVVHQYISLLSEGQYTLFLVNFVVISVCVDGVLHNDTTIWAVLAKEKLCYSFQLL